MKIAIAGKGGVGKTFIAGTLARFFAADGLKVLAVDNDPSMNLIYSLGMDPDLRYRITPISKMRNLIEERTGMSSLGPGIYNANPHVSDIPDKYKIPGPDGLSLLVLGTIEEPSTGCFCAPNALIRTLLAELILNRDEVVIIDFEAGLEHLGRGTSRGIDIMLIVTEAYRKSLDLSEKMLDLTRKLGIGRIYIVGNKIRTEHEKEIIEKWAAEHGADVIGMIPYDEKIAECELESKAPYDTVPSGKAVKAVKAIQRELKKIYVSEG